MQNAILCLWKSVVFVKNSKKNYMNTYNVLVDYKQKINAFSKFVLNIEKMKKDCSYLII